MVHVRITVSFVKPHFSIGNEQSVGEALRESNIKRGDIFLTTKLACVVPVSFHL